MGEVTSPLPTTSASSLPPLLYNVPSSWATTPLQVQVQEQKNKCEDVKAAKGPSQKLPKSSNGETKKKGAEGKGDEPNTNVEKNGEEETAVTPPPEDIVMRVFMHCEGCARKVQRCLRSCEGVEDVWTNCRAHRVVVKGKAAAADPVKIAEKLQRKTGRRVELLTPIPPKPEAAVEEEKKVEPESPKPEEKKEEPQLVAVVLKVHMHCDACAQEIKKRILKLKGVQTVEPEQKASQVTVSGAIDAKALVDYVYRRTGKHAAVLKEEVVEAVNGEDSKDADEGEEEGGGRADEEGGSGVKDPDSGGGGEDGSVGGEEVQRVDEAAMAAMAARLPEMRRNEMMMYYYYHQQQQQQYQQHYPIYHQVEYAYPPQTFSDENPNACSLM